jgi:pimeloyl-ACP methyl ester carboxylesterase
MATFIFLHGSFHAAWNWHRLLPLMARAGHRSIALDLPGHGRDRTPPSRVTLDTCVETVIACIDAQHEPVVLVAHSRNGIVISQTAERRPEKILGLVYLAAYLVPNGKSMMDYAITDVESLVVRNLEMALDRKFIPLLMRLFRHEWVRRLCARILPAHLQVHRLKCAAYREALYHDCDDDITELANVLLEAEPNWAGFSRLQLSAERYGKVPKVYIECLQDRAVTLALQRRMLAETPCHPVFSLDSSHSPFFSQPENLAQVLMESLRVLTRRPTLAPELARSRWPKYG